ncbi:hypothetical protein HH800_05620 [Sphingobium yanoikuyae]|uniref:Uncharacterized protein n=1 Tax=Sphingobium yanoikuyae TaxID=13690 RepID=A0A6M4G7T2_SPHYA|nr:hypothetical protein [Sphingobium yanoikuyae]QJR01717.1 hypothetical protein HH800_05620 [Sphingobium yanoikuyae]
MSSDDHAHLMGRIAALELLATTSLVDMSMRTPGDDPLSSLKSMRTGLFSSLQHIDRASGDFADQVWDELATALNETFDRAETRIENALRD